jgi:16S rRNA (cytosine1402-N4)-methyltransferase
LLTATLDALRIADRPAGRFVDGTLGAGGHAAAILTAAPESRLLGLDRDPVALALARERLAPFGDRVTLRHASYERIGEIVPAWVGADADGVDGILLDLGLSSMQVDDPARGFAFMQDGPLDMRFDPSSGGITAAEIVNRWDAEALADLLFRYGEERNSRRIARAILAARPIDSTRQLAGIVAGAQRGPRQKIHPATRTFQALRIWVNRELEGLDRFLREIVGRLRAGGRLAVIAFHSLEDRIVKQTFRALAGPEAAIRLLTKRPLRPCEEEVAANPRARSAKLRAAERLS